MSVTFSDYATVIKDLSNFDVIFSLSSISEHNDRMVK